MKLTKADKWFSMYIRLRDADENGVARCITCGKIKDVRYMDCGHFIGRQHMATRFSEMNAHAQCKQCNGFEEGRKNEYERKLIDIYGENNVNLLKVLGKSTKRTKKFELEQIAKYYENKAKEEARDKNLKLW